MSKTWDVEELTDEERAALVSDTEHHQQPSCQSDDQSDGESDLSTTPVAPEVNE